MWYIQLYLCKEMTSILARDTNYVSLLNFLHHGSL